MTNQEIANEILLRIGDRPVPFESVRGVALQIYHELEGQQPDESFNDVYEILLSILPLTHRGADIDDYNVSTGTTWSSNKITSVLEDYVTNNDASVFITKEALDGYATEEFVNSSLGNYYTKSDASTLFNPYNTVTPNVTKPAARFIKWNERGQIVGEAYKAYNKPLSINGVEHTTWRADLVDFPSIYAPTTAGTTGQYLVSSGSGAPVWKDLSDDTSIYLTANDISTFVTESELADYATKNDISTFITENDASVFLTDEDLVGYATESFVNSSLGNYYTKSEVNTSLGLKQDTLIAGNNITIENNVISATGSGMDSSNYYTKAEVDASLNLKADKTQLEEYAKVVELTQVEYDALTTKDTDTLYIITDAIPFDPSNYYTKDEVDDKLYDYTTKNDVSAFITQKDVSIYAIASDVDASLALKADKAELNGYATKNDISTFITSNDISTFITENDASIYLTDEDLVGYATESFVNTSLGNYYTKSDASTLFNPYNTVAANDAGVALFPIWNARGQVIGHNWSAFRKDLTINGVAKKVWGSVQNETIESFYAPTTAGTEGYCLVANANGIPVWSDVLGDISTALATILGV